MHATSLFVVADDYVSGPDLHNFAAYLGGLGGAALVAAIL